MKVLLIIISFWVGLVSMTVQPESFFGKKETKKINKMISRTWKDVAINLEAIKLPDTIDDHYKMEFPENSLFQLKEGNEIKGFLTVNEANGCIVGGCSETGCTEGECSPIREEKEYEKYIHAIIFDTNLNILQVAVIEYDGQYGFEICSRSWLKQFIGAGYNINYGKEIDAIAGATISGISITESVKHINIEMIAFRHKGIL